MSRSVPRAYQRKDFLDSAEARGIRILSEYLEPERRFACERIWHTVVMFGSARLIDAERAQRELAELEEWGAGETDVLRARRQLEMAKYYEGARKLAGMITEWSAELPEEERLVVCTGGGGGIMEAGTRGAAEAGGRAVSLNIQLPTEQEPNPWIDPDRSFDFHYFFMRKFWFIHRAKAAIIFPGGFGTLDELMELLTLAQTGRVDKRIPIVIYGRDFWDRVIRIEALADWGMISPEDLDLFKYADSPEEALDIVKDAFRVADPGLRRSHTTDVQ